MNIDIEKIVLVVGVGHNDRITIHLKNFKVTNYSDPQYNSATLLAECSPGKGLSFIKENFSFDEKDIEIINIKKILEDL